ncbi:MAG: LysE family transporter [Saprospiraceae bacterium]|nr:LysE family transporter [Bacteroidia bacterium]NNE15360.1 LysE family transporter [Saprospiraceae bacterium]NNL92440.1 LysE family transporter [Saprospiraceae bacterium]
MSIFIEGLLSGLLLACSLGPIFIALTHTSLEKGTVPGLVVGTGIWISDIIIVLLMYNFIYKIRSTIESQSFIFWMGMSGAIILILFGIGLLLKKPTLDYHKIKIKKSDYFGFWLKGFLVNTVNPFTFIFWMGIISTYMIGRSVSNNQLALLLGTIIGVIILSDMFKVYLANFLKKWLTPNHINIIANLSGVILIIFGLFLGYKTM